ncbi:MAG TPA: nicotinate-nucleotide--dimethylbenzimidazole phosphoribosyltransferase [Steroidobacteraceae bacterium]
MSSGSAAIDVAAGDAARARQLQLTKPPGSLGRLEDLACWFAARWRNPIPLAPQCEVFVFAGDHGVAARGVSAFPQSVTGQMVGNFARGGAAINVLAALEGCRIEVVDVGVASDGPPPPGVRNERVRAGTRDLAATSAMSTEELRAALAVGARCARAAADRGTRLIIAGDMGIANSTSAACLICVFTGATPESVVGRGTGVDDAGLARKREVVHVALARAAKGGSPEPARMLAELGGLEIAAIAGLYLESARLGIPVMLDGYISTAAALAAAAIEPGVVDWMLASHRSAEAGHRFALEKLKLEPLVDLRLRLGEGTGAALVLPIVRAALALHAKMATFGEAGVSGAIDAAK